MNKAQAGIAAAMAMAAPYGMGIRGRLRREHAPTKYDLERLKRAEQKRQRRRERRLVEAAREGLHAWLEEGS